MDDDIYRDFAQQGQEQAAREAMYRSANIKQQADQWDVSLALAEHLVKLEERIRDLEQRGG